MWDESIREIPKMWKDGPYSYEGKYFRMPEREVFPKPYGNATRPCGWRPAAPRRSPRPARWASARSASRTARPTQIAPLIARLQGRRRRRHAGRRLRQRQHHGGHQHALHGGPRGRPSRPPSACGMNYYTSLQMHWLDNIPKPEGLPVWPDRIPEPTRRPARRRSAEIGMVVVGDPDDCAKAVQQWVDIGVDQLCFSPTTNNLAHRRGHRRRWSCSAKRSSRSSTRTRCTAPPGTARRASPASGRLTERRRTSDATEREQDPGATRPVPQSFNFADIWEAVWRPRRRPRRPLVCGDAAAHLRRARGRGPTGSPALGCSARASSRATTSGSTS